MKTTQRLTSRTLKTLTAVLFLFGTIPVAAQAAKPNSKRGTAPKAEAKPLLKVVKGSSSSELVTTEVRKMDDRENKLQSCLIELKVPMIYEARINRSRQMIELIEAADPKKTVYTSPVDSRRRDGNFDLEKFFKSAVYNRLLKELRAKDEIAAQVKPPSFLERLFGKKTTYNKMMEKYDYKGQACADFLASVGRQKLGAELQIYIASYDKNLASLRGKAPHPTALSAFVKAGSRPGLAFNRE